MNFKLFFNNMLSFFVLILGVVFLSACDQTSDQSIAKKTGSAIGSIATDFTSGIGMGVDNKLQVTVELTQEVIEAGLKHTISKGSMLEKEIKVYFIAEKDIDTQLLTKAINSENLEIGRSIVPIKMKKDHAEYISFSFDDGMDSQLVKKYIIELKK